MEGMTELIGTNAGLVWEVLRASKKAMTDKEIKSATKISTLREVHFALGWLAREDKLVFEEGSAVAVRLKELIIRSRMSGPVGDPET